MLIVVVLARQRFLDLDQDQVVQVRGQAVACSAHLQHAFCGSGLGIGEDGQVVDGFFAGLCQAGAGQHDHGSNGGTGGVAHVVNLS